jgi:hypothetical protein
VLRPLGHAAPVRIEVEEDGAFRVVSDRVERWVAMLPVEEPALRATSRDACGAPVWSGR